MNSPKFRNSVVPSSCFFTHSGSINRHGHLFKYAILRIVTAWSSICIVLKRSSIYLLRQLQSVLNASARPIYHFIDTLVRLHQFGCGSWSESNTRLSYTHVWSWARNCTALLGSACPWVWQFAGAACSPFCQLEIFEVWLFQHCASLQKAVVSSTSSQLRTVTRGLPSSRPEDVTSAPSLSVFCSRLKNR